MATKKKIEVVSVGGNVKYDGKYRVPGTDSARFKCEEAIAVDLKKAKVVVDAEVFDAQQAPTEEQPEQGGPVEVTLDLLRAEYPEIVKKLEAEAREGMCSKEQFDEALAKSTKDLFTKDQFDEAAAAIPDGYVAKADVEVKVKALQGEIEKLKKKS